MYFSNTALFNDRGIYSILHKVQQHVSALDNGHLKVVHEILTKQSYKTYMDCIHGAGRREVGMRSHICHRGWEVCVLGGTLLLYLMTKLI